MGILDRSETWNKVLAIIPDPEVKEKVERQWTEHPNKSGAEKWDILESAVSKAEKKKKYKDEVVRDIKFQYCYPRLDVKVSTAINHLLKSPFCVHPKTCKSIIVNLEIVIINFFFFIVRVCVPIQVDECENFNPLTVPDLTTLDQELEKYNQANSDSSRLADYKKTSLKPYVEYFEKFVNSIILDVTRSKRGKCILYSVLKNYN